MGNNRITLLGHESSQNIIMQNERHQPLILDDPEGVDVLVLEAANSNYKVPLSGANEFDITIADKASGVTENIVLSSSSKDYQEIADVIVSEKCRRELRFPIVTTSFEHKEYDFYLDHAGDHTDLYDISLRDKTTGGTIIIHNAIGQDVLYIKSTILIYMKGNEVAVKAIHINSAVTVNMVSDVTARVAEDGFKNIIIISSVADFERGISSDAFDNAIVIMANVSQIHELVSEMFSSKTVINCSASVAKTSLRRLKDIDTNTLGNLGSLNLTDLTYLTIE